MLKPSVTRWCFVVFLIIEAIATVSYIRWRNLQVANSFKLALPATAAWAPDRAKRGSSSAKYRLVEFGDFQCPPCKLASEEIELWQRANQNEICFEFRHLPLTSIHPFSYKLALASESVSDSEYWATHRRLYELQGKANAYSGLKLGNGLAKAVAAKRVAIDMAIAEAYAWESTPTLLLITPGGTVYRCPNVAAAKLWIGQGV